MIQTLTKNWWLLVVCGLLEAAIAAIYLLMYDSGPDGYLSLHGWWNAPVALSTRLALAAGLCAIAAGTFRSANGAWLIVLNGAALSAFGLIPLLWRGPLSIDLFDLLIVVMATAFGILAFAIARTLRNHTADEWSFGLAGAVSIGFALAFLALVSRLIQLERRPFHPSAFLWMCLYFGFSAICMLGLGMRLHSQSQSTWNAASPLADPNRAH